MEMMDTEMDIEQNWKHFDLREGVSLPQIIISDAATFVHGDQANH